MARTVDVPTLLRQRFMQCPKMRRQKLAQEIADAIGVQRETVRNWYRDHRVAQRWRPSVLAWLEGRQEDVPEAERLPPVRRPRKVQPGHWWEFRPYFDNDDAHEDAMRKADEYVRKGWRIRAHRIRLNLDNLRLGQAG